jgi:hypothetical protein
MLKASCDAAERQYQIRSRDRATSRRLMRIYRSRLAAGARCLTVEIANWDATLDAFIAAGVLAPEQRTDKKAVARAVATLCRRGHAVLVAEQEAKSTSPQERPAVVAVEGARPSAPIT